MGNPEVERLVEPGTTARTGPLGTNHIGVNLQKCIPIIPILAVPYGWNTDIGRKSVPVPWYSRTWK